LRINPGRNYFSTLLAKQRIIRQLHPMSMRNIYNKDKFLDKSNYKASEDEYFNLLSDTEKREHIMSKLGIDDINSPDIDKALADIEQEQKKIEGQKHDEEEKKVIDITKIRSMFDTIIEMQSDPEGQKAKEFERQMEQFESQNPNKKKTQVFIKTMRSGRIISNEKRLMGNDTLSGPEKLLQNAYDYLQHSFPEENYLEDFELHHYRYPAETKPVGIVFFFHDQSKYMGKYAHVAECLSKKNIEVVGFDLPGHGKNTKGTRGYFGTFDDVKKHSYKFINSTIAKLGYTNLPKFSIGVSTGALTALTLAVENERLFNGVNIICPLLKNEGAKPRGNSYIDFLGKAFPKLGMAKVNTEAAQPFDDPLLFNGKLRAGLFKELEETTFHVRRNASNLTIPILVAHGGIDTITPASVVREYFEEVPTQDKDIIMYDD